MFLQVVSQTSPVVSQTLNENGQQTTKCYIRLRELGGRYADEYVCIMMGEMAERRFAPGTMVAASLRFTVREAEGRLYPNVFVNEIAKIDC